MLSRGWAAVARAAASRDSVNCELCAYAELISQVISVAVLIALSPEAVAVTASHATRHCLKSCFESPVLAQEGMGLPKASGTRP